MKKAIFLVALWLPLVTMAQEKGGTPQMQQMPVVCDSLPKSLPAKDSLCGDPQRPLSDVAPLSAGQPTTFAEPTVPTPGSPYKFRPTHLIAPVTLVALGVTGVTTSAMRNVNRRVSAGFAGNPRRGSDDYVQYVPWATPYVLKLTGVPSRHNYGEYTILVATSYLSKGLMVNALKYSVRERRPDSSTRNSFPSGHTATAFMGAELLRSEFWEVSPWIGIGGYLVAGTVGFMRVWHNRHWMTDVVAGAGIGILSVRIAYWLFPPLQHLFFRGKHYKSSTLVASLMPYYDGRQLGGALAMHF